jgi:xylan 1,4-beta-xylosidase
MKTFSVDFNSSVKLLEKYWNLCVGSCHATTALREDYRRQLEQCQREIGFRYLRFHGLFDDDMSVVRQNPGSDELILSFSNIDNIFDFLLSIGMKPFIELGFMPDCLKSKDTTVFHYQGNTAPPADYDKWARFIRSFMEHLISRYGRDEVRQWFFEVWNEPNLGGAGSQDGFWTGSMEEYFKLYQVTAEVIKSVDSFARVGGPATSNNAWIPEMIDFCKRSGAPIDFISTHHYPTDVVLGYGVEDSQNFAKPGKDDLDEESAEKLEEQKSVFYDHLWERVDRGVLTDMTKKAVEEAAGLPVYYTEWNSLAGMPSDGPFGSSFIAKTVLDGAGLVEGYSYWTFSDIFEEGGMPSAAFHGGFGLLTMQGVPKASYRAFQLLQELGDKMYEQKMADGTVDVYAVRKDVSGTVQLMAINHHSLLHPISEETAKITVTGLKVPEGTPLPVEIKRVDDIHGNALHRWMEMGSPKYVTPGQVCALKAASEVTAENAVVTVSGGCAEIELTVPPMGMVLVNLYLN